jgi:hypothetical protein
VGSDSDIGASLPGGAVSSARRAPSGRLPWHDVTAACPWSQTTAGTDDCFLVRGGCPDPGLGADPHSRCPCQVRGRAKHSDPELLRDGQGQHRRHSACRGGRHLRLRRRRDLQRGPSHRDSGELRRPRRPGLRAVERGGRRDPGGRGCRDHDRRHRSDDRGGVPGAAVRAGDGDVRLRRDGGSRTDG